MLTLSPNDQNHVGTVLLNRATSKLCPHPERVKKEKGLNIQIE